MKIEVKSTKEFRPIKLELTIETEEELCDLWHRMNMPREIVDKNLVDILFHKSISCSNLWSKLNNLVITNNLYKTT